MKLTDIHAQYPVGTTATVPWGLSEVTLTITDESFAVIFDEEWRPWDVAENLDTAVAYINDEDCHAVAILDTQAVREDGRGCEALQGIVNREIESYNDCFGATKSTVDVED